MLMCTFKINEQLRIIRVGWIYQLSKQHQQLWDHRIIKKNLNGPKFVKKNQQIFNSN